jgi:hypothetical protein
MIDAIVIPLILTVVVLCYGYSKLDTGSSIGSGIINMFVIPMTLVGILFVWLIYFIIY